MKRRSLDVWLALVVVVLATASIVDLRRVETSTLVVYTTPALQDFLEKGAFPAFQKATGTHIVPLYSSAGEEYYRLKLSSVHPEADLFLMAAPLYLEKGHAEGLFADFNVTGARMDTTNVSAADDAGHYWYAFAWSPLVEVYSKATAAVPELSNFTGAVGFPHPLLSNNGVYGVILFEKLDPDLGKKIVSLTVVQPTNARATIGGVADGSYDITLGYEAVAALYVAKGAKVSYALPRVHGMNVTTPVLFVAGIVKTDLHPQAKAFVDFLLKNSTQAMLPKYYMRNVDNSSAGFKAALSLKDAQMVNYDWGSWQQLESLLKKYEVKK